MTANEVTEINCEAPFVPEAALLNAGNYGFCQVALDDKMVGFFLENLGLIESDIDRSLLWIVLRDQVN